MKTAMKPLFLATTFAIASMAGAMTAAHADESATKEMDATPIKGLSGNIGVVSQYIFRGFVENDSPSVQGGIDWAGDNGVYVGYWGSNIGYGDDGSKGVENDFYVGWGGGDKFTWDLGLLYYAYLNVTDANVPELYGSIGYGPVTLGTTYALDDAIWINKGDMYWTLAAEGEVAGGFNLGAKAAWYYYGDEGEFLTDQTRSSAFNSLDLSVSHALGATGADMGLHYIVGGKTRFDNDLDDNIVLSLSFGF